MVSDERETLVGRLVGLLPLPFPWAALLIAAILGAPGSLLVAYLEVGDVERSVAAFFHGYIPERTWQQVLTVVLWYAFYATLSIYPSSGGWASWRSPSSSVSSPSSSRTSWDSRTQGKATICP